MSIINDPNYIIDFYTILATCIAGLAIIFLMGFWIGAYWQAKKDEPFLWHNHPFCALEGDGEPPTFRWRWWRARVERTN